MDGWTNIRSALQKILPCVVQHICVSCLTGHNSFVIWQEHLIGLSDEWLEDRPKSLSVKDQTTISRLEKQAEEFLNAVLCRKGESQWWSGPSASVFCIVMALMCLVLQKKLQKRWQMSTIYLNVNILKIKLRLLCPMEIDLSIFVFYVVLHVGYQTDFYSLKFFLMWL